MPLTVKRIDKVLDIGQGNPGQVDIRAKPEVVGRLALCRSFEESHKLVRSPDDVGILALHHGKLSAGSPVCRSNGDDAGAGLVGVWSHGHKNICTGVKCSLFGVTESKPVRIGAGFPVAVGAHGNRELLTGEIGLVSSLVQRYGSWGDLLCAGEEYPRTKDCQYCKYLFHISISLHRLHIRDSV